MAAAVEEEEDDERGRGGKKEKTHEATPEVADAAGIICAACRTPFRQQRYLADHVRAGRCLGRKKEELQCTRCGVTGDAEWTATHMYRRHRVAYLRDFCKGD